MEDQVGMVGLECPVLNNVKPHHSLIESYADEDSEVGGRMLSRINHRDSI